MMPRVALLCCLVSCVCNDTRADYNAYIFPYLCLFSGQVITNDYSWNIWALENSVEETRSGDVVTYRKTRTIRIQETNLPPGITFGLVGSVNETDTRRSGGVVTRQADIYNMRGTIQHCGAETCHDGTAIIIEEAIAESREYIEETQEWSPLMPCFAQTRELHARMRVDDYVGTFDNPPDPRICRLLINQGSTSAWLHARCDWYRHNITYWGDCEQLPPRNVPMPPDVDCFEVSPQNHNHRDFTIRVISASNIPVRVECTVRTHHFVIEDTIIQTNIPISIGDGDVHITVSSPNAEVSVPYTIEVFRKSPVIIVHGLMDGPRTENDNDHLWHDLRTMLTYGGHPCEYLYYSTGQTSLKTATERLYDLINRLYEIDTSSVVVIAHSTGALIADLCLARYRSSSFHNRVKTLIAIGGVHRGSLFANIWRDVSEIPFVGSLLDCSNEIKDALEVGSAPISYIYERNVFSRTISLAGYWGSMTHHYYRGYQDYSVFPNLPKRYPYHFMDSTYLEASDGMVPYFSACASDIGNERYLVHSHDKQKGMCHSNTLKSNPWIDPLYRENSMLVGNADRHGMYHTVTNILEGGDLRSMQCTEPVPQRIGALCLLLDVPQVSEYGYQAIIAENEKEWQAWKQDVDKDVGKGIPNMAAVEQPYHMFFAPGGVYNLYVRYLVARQRYNPYNLQQSPFTLTEHRSSHVTVRINGGRLDLNTTPIPLYWEPYEKNDH